MKRLFIINPKSGKNNRASELEQIIKTQFYDADIVFTKAAGHATKLVANAVKQNYEQVIVAGGDGTINEAASSLVGTKTALGVIAFGSGNGLAREIGCPLDNLQKACNNIYMAKPVLCDIGKANGEYFLNVAGIGLEATIAHAFANVKTRGMLPYFKIGFTQVLKYKAPKVEVWADDKSLIFLNPTTLVFANGKQYGSNFKIAPQASLTDGKLDMVYIEEQPLWKLALGFPNFFKPNFTSVKLTKSRTIKKAVITGQGKFVYHLDGEPKQATDKLEIEVLPKAIHLLIS
jgi:lipid kinase, YegS/Rv2252/BmrU family